jgi:hypothetical protein
MGRAPLGANLPVRQKRVADGVLLGMQSLSLPGTLWPLLSASLTCVEWTPCGQLPWPQEAHPGGRWKLGLCWSPRIIHCWGSLGPWSQGLMFRTSGVTSDRSVTSVSPTVKWEALPQPRAVPLGGRVFPREQSQTGPPFLGAVVTGRGPTPHLLGVPGDQLVE